MASWQEELQEAKELFDSGILSKEDFEQLRTEALRKREVLISRGFTGQISDRIELILIPLGRFMMGALSDDDEALDEEVPRHEVEISRSFYAGKYPVTQKLWKEVMEDNPSYHDGDNHPVEKVSWLDCIRFCNDLSFLEGRTQAYTINGEDVFCDWEANGYRLLTEAEWEYCARAEQNTLYSGSNDLNEVAWWGKNSGDETHPVGLKKPNHFGLYDMVGNVWEWCWDGMRDYSEEKQVDPKGNPDDSWRSFRGGSYCNFEEGSRVSFRVSSAKTYSRDNLGFRIGCNI